VHLAHIEQKVHMIGDTAYNDIWRIDAPNYGCQVRVDPRPNSFVEKRSPILRAENQMGVELRE